MNCFAQFWPREFKISSKMTITDDKGNQLAENELKDMQAKDGEAEISAEATMTTGTPGDYPHVCKWDLTVEHEGQSYTQNVIINKTIVVYC